MSELSVEVCQVEEVIKIEHTNRLFSCRVKGWWVVSSGIDSPEGIAPPYRVGQSCLYFPIDSILPARLEAFLFPEGSKIVLKNSRIRTIKIQKTISQGMIINLSPELLSLYPALMYIKMGDDVKDILGVTKYEPPIKALPNHMRIKSKKVENPDFKKYTDIDHLDKYNKVFNEDDLVVCTEKIHGSNMRVGILPKTASTWWKKVLKYFGLLKGYERCLGSRTVQKHLQPKDRRAGWYPTDIWSRTEEKYKLLDKLLPGEALYGEVYGPTIQKGYHYGMENTDVGFVAFDLMKDGLYLNHNDFIEICKQRGIPTVPVLYKGRFNQKLIDKLASGDSILEPKQKVIEGVVVRPITEQNHHCCGRVILKKINPEYLLKDQTEWH